VRRTFEIEEILYIYYLKFKKTFIRFFFCSIERDKHLYKIRNRFLLIIFLSILIKATIFSSLEDTFSFDKKETYIKKSSLAIGIVSTVKKDKEVKSKNLSYDHTANKLDKKKGKETVFLNTAKKDKGVKSKKLSYESTAKKINKKKGKETAFLSTAKKDKEIKSKKLSYESTAKKTYRLVLMTFSRKSFAKEYQDTLDFPTDIVFSKNKYIVTSKPVEGFDKAKQFKQELINLIPKDSYLSSHL